MGEKIQVRTLYQNVIQKATSDPATWREICHLIGKLYRYEFDNILMVYAQRPDATLIADFDTWKQVGRYVRRGSRGIAIFPSRALAPSVRFVFDISNTGGREQELTWTFDDEKINAYLDFQEQAGTSGEGDTFKNNSWEALKDFTKTYVRYIMKAEFGERISELSQDTGSVINGLGDVTQEITAEDMIYQSVLYAVGTRCGFDLSSEKTDFSGITSFVREDEIYRLGSLVSDISCYILREISRILKMLKMERSIAYERDSINVYGEGRNSISQSGNGGGQGPTHVGEIRNHGDELPERKLRGPLQEPAPVRPAGGENAGSGSGGQSEAGLTDKRISAGESTLGQELNHADVGDKTAGTDTGGGNRNSGSNQSVSLKPPTEEIQDGALEIQPLTDIQRGSRFAASFLNGVLSAAYPEGVSYGSLNPKLEQTIPSEYIKEVLLSDGRFKGTRKRIYEVFQMVEERDRRIEKLKEEYGVGGRTFEGNTLSYDSFQESGIRIQWQDSGRKEGYLSWKSVEEEIEKLIIAGEYYKAPEFAEEERIPQELWQEPLSQFFLKGFWSEVPSAILYELSSSQLSIEEQADFLRILYYDYRYKLQPQPAYPSKYGLCQIGFTVEGLTADFYNQDKSQLQVRLSWIETASFLSSLVKTGMFRPYISLEEIEADIDSYIYNPELREIYDEAANFLLKALEKGEPALELPEEYLEPTFSEVEDSALWRKPLQCFFDGELLFMSIKVLVYDILTTNLEMEVKEEFIEEIYGAGYDGVTQVAQFENPYGLCEIRCLKDGVEVEYMTQEQTTAIKYLDYGYCTSLILHLIEENRYLSETVFEQLRKEPKAFWIEPEYREIYQSYKRRMENQPEFKPISLEESAPMTGDVLDRDGNVLYSAKQNPEKENFSYDGWAPPTGGPKTRYQYNIQAIKTLKQIEQENRYATKEEQKVLSTYVGWGGISQAFDQTNDRWAAEYQELRELLSESEYQAARASVNSAFYTPSAVTKAIYQALANFGFQTGNILEPSLGIGNFFAALPPEMRNSQLYGVEVDSITARIATLLFPNARIEHKGFEKTTFPDNFFDCAIGNIPFGDYGLFDTKYNKYHLKIHDYFLTKALDQVRAGGIIAFVCSKFIMDKANGSVRKYLSERAELIGAIRLPDNVFSNSAGTEITSDILFFKKREQKTFVEQDWLHLGYTEEGVPVNAYFIEHPEMMLGHMEFLNRGFGDDSTYTTCKNRQEGFDLEKALSQAIGYLSTEYTQIEVEELGESSMDIIPADPDVRNYSYVFKDDVLYYRQDSLMYRKELPDKTVERIKGLSEIRELTRQLIFIQTEGCSEEELKSCQDELNRQYDCFVKKYGSINSRGNRGAFRDDSDYPLLCSLEAIDENGEIHKADMFYKQTIRPRKEINRVETAVEALNISMNEQGKVNIPFMLSLFEPDISKHDSQSQPLSEEKIEELRWQAIIDDLRGIIFLDPLQYDENDKNMGWQTADEYLSGNVRSKLRIAEAHMKTRPDLFGLNVEALKRVQPQDLDASEISARIGATWIDFQDYEQFIYELLGTPKRYQAIEGFRSNKDIQVKFNQFNSGWFIENKSLDYRSVAATKTYGTERMDAYAIFEDTLNLRTVTVRDRIDEGGSVRYVVNTKETMLAREKQDLMKAEFESWLFRDPERRAKYVTLYNETFNSIRLREFDGSYMTFPGMNPDITLQAYQKNAIARGVLGGNTLLAHCVGAGKSFEMSAIAMELRRLGLANKPAMIVPKSVVTQAASEFLKLYPSANILLTQDRDFEKSRRKQFIARIATGDYDCIIMSHSQFEKIPISKERRERLLREQINTIITAIGEMKQENNERWTIKQMESQVKRLEAQLEYLADETRKDELICFEDLGIDCLLVDEAHNFKNLAIFSKMNNVAGISGTGSQRAMDLYLKCRYLREINGNRGVIFATGTPISNTMCELYVFQKFLQEETLERAGIHCFDDWASIFGEVTTALELTVEGSGFRFKSRFNKFVNLPELMTMFREVADIKTADMLNLPIPQLRGGNYIIEQSEPDWFVESVMEEFVKRAEAIRSGMVDPSVDNFLKITHEARLLGIDARLLYPDAPINPDGKLNHVVDKVAAEYFAFNQEGNIGCQLIFSDVGVPRDKEFDVYHFIKEELVNRGIPEPEIQFIHTADTDSKRATLFKNVRSGKCKILLGSTDKCGTGVNVQDYIVAVHHVDSSWKPSSIEQRDGRALRRGNNYKEVAIYRYVTKRTFDAYNWSILENKQRFISQIMTGREVARSCDDIDEATLSFAEIKAIASGNPLIKEKMEIDNEVQRLRVLKSSYDSQRYSLQDDFMVRLPKLLANVEGKLERIQVDIRKRDSTPFKEGEFSVKIGQAIYTERTEAGQAMLELATKCRSGDTLEVGEFRGFAILVQKNFIEANYLFLRGQADYPAELSSSPVGNMVKLENLLQGFEVVQQNCIKKIEQYQRDIKQAKEEYEKVFPYEEVLKQKLARQKELNEELDLENKVSKEAESEKEKKVVPLFPKR